MDKLADTGSADGEWETPLALAETDSIMENPKNKIVFKNIAEQLQSKGYGVSYFETAKEAAAYIKSSCDRITPRCEDTRLTIGIGGSMTAVQMNLMEVLGDNNEVICHTAPPEGMSVNEARVRAFRSQVFISSVNAISQDGIIVNLDNTGNRVAAVSYGPEKIFLVAGRNKIVRTLEDAVYRTRNTAAPLNAMRMKLKTPCAVKGDRCYNCNSPERICRSLSILLMAPKGAEYQVILVDENLGY